LYSAAIASVFFLISSGKENGDYTLDAKSVNLLLQIEHEGKSPNGFYPPHPVHGRSHAACVKTIVFIDSPQSMRPVISQGFPRFLPSLPYGY